MAHACHAMLHAACESLHCMTHGPDGKAVCHAHAYICMVKLEALLSLGSSNWAVGSFSLLVDNQGPC